LNCLTICLRCSACSTASRRHSENDLNTLLAIGVRNVNRNRRRTGLTIAGISFAIWLVGVAAALQDGSYRLQRQMATDLMTGHVQLSHPAWPARPGVEQLIDDASALTQRIEGVAGVAAVFPRVQFFGMAAVVENSVAVQIMGLDFNREEDHTTLIRRISEGRLPGASDEAVIGAALARNLDTHVGDEVAILASDPAGAMAALSVRISGLLQTGVNDLDRMLVLVPYATAAEALGMHDEVHLLVVRGERPETAVDLAARISAEVPQSVLVRSWQMVMPEIEEAIELDRLGGYPFYGIILFLVTFSVANTFVMVVFERIREFGMLRSLGMQPLGIIGLLQIESLVLWFAGALVGLLLLLITVSVLATVGIPLGERLEATLTQMYMPTRIYAAFSPRAFLIAPLVLLFTTQIAAFLPALRIRHIQPSHALRMGA
jgi:ABC-type lipoprotein release transport system permease subunit